MAPEHLELAFDRTDDFVAVRAGRPARDQRAASELLQEGVRIGPLVRPVLCRRMESAPVGEVAQDGAGRVASLGIVAGRVAGEFAREACQPRL